MGDRLGTPWLPVKNASADTVPPGGLVVPTGAVDADTGGLIVDKPTTDDQAGFLVNGEFSLAAGGSGNAADQNNAVVAYDPADGTPAAGQTWGVGAGTFLARKGRSGFVVVAGGEPGTFVGMRYQAPPAQAPGAARLIASTGWQGRSWTVGGGWADNAASGANFEAVEIDGITFLQKPTANAVYWPSRAPGYYEGLPVQYANKVGGTYYPGFMSTGAIGTQTFGGDKTFDGTVLVHDSLTVNYAHTGASFQVNNNATGTTFGVYPGSVAGVELVTVGPVFQAAGQYAPSVGGANQLTVSGAVNTLALSLYINNALATGPHGESVSFGQITCDAPTFLGSPTMNFGVGGYSIMKLGGAPGTNYTLTLTALSPGGFVILEGGTTPRAGLWGTNAVGDTFKGGILTGFGAGGSVTSVQVSGGTTGLTTSGGPITGAGTITLGGTLSPANGGTGLVNPPAGQVLAGGGSGALQPVPTTRVNGSGSLELQVGTGKWLNFTLGSF